MNLRLLSLFCVLVLRCSVDLDIEGQRELPQSLRQNSDGTTLPDDTILSCWRVFPKIPDDNPVCFLQTCAAVDEMIRETPNMPALFVEWVSLVQEEQRKMALIRHDGQKDPALLEEKREHAQQEQQAYDLQYYQNWIRKSPSEKIAILSKGRIAPMPPEDTTKHSRPTRLAQRYLDLFKPEPEKCAKKGPKVFRFQSIEFIPQSEESLRDRLGALRDQQSLYKNHLKQKDNPQITNMVVMSVRRFAVLNIITANLPSWITALSKNETLKNDTGWMQAVRTECYWIHHVRMIEERKYS